LGVDIHQSLVQQDKTWVLECVFVFDFHNTSSSSSAADNASSSSTSTNNHNITKYIMSNIMSGTTVNVAITLQECDNIADQQSNIPTRMAASSVGGGQQQQQHNSNNNNQIIVPMDCSHASSTPSFSLRTMDCVDQGRRQGVRRHSSWGGNVGRIDI